MKLYIPSHLTGEKVQGILKALPRSRNKDYIKAADLMIKRNTYTLPPFGIVSYSALIKWEDNRSHSYLRLIHGHTFLGCLIDAYCEKGDPRYIVKGIDLIRNWIYSYPFETSQDKVAYHNETTALRMQYWLRFYILAKQELSESDCLLLEKAMSDTAALLAQDSFHATNTTHGMFQDISLLVFASYFEGADATICEQYKQLTILRLKEYFEGICTEDGVHKEQSPSYHMLVVSYLKKLVDWLEVTDEALSRVFIEMYQRMEDYSIHIIRPDGYFPPICDTEAKLVGNSGYGQLYNSKEYLYAVTKGEQGEPPKENDKVFPKSGYAIFRDDWEKKEKATYVLFTAAYNADYHKHSDDLNVYIYSDGEIITEAGPNGYNYQDSFTKYAYSSFAHNTLIIDGKGLPRTDKQYDKVYVSDYCISKDEAEATGVNLRYEGVKHTRNVKYPKREKRVVIHDSILSDKRHEYKLLWHVAPDITVHVRDRIVELFRDTKKVMEIEVFTEAPVRISTVKEQIKPQMQGWVFPKMEEKEPSTTIEVDLSGSNVECKTEFRLDSFKVGKEGILPFQFEKVFESTRSLRYYFEEAKEEQYKDKLFVVFSAMSPKYNFVFNYMKSLQEAPVNKLFILDDFGDQGSYYIGNQRDHSIETAVTSLIQYTMAKHKVSHENVTTIGSSKGGYAALYFGLKYYFGNIISGAPQSKIGSYLIKQTPGQNIAGYIAGSAEEGDCYYLDQLLFQLLNQPNEVSPNIHIMIGTRDHHYANHVMPLHNMLLHQGYNVSLDVENGLTHEDLKMHFPIYLQKKVENILNGKIFSSPILKEPVIQEVKVEKIGMENIVVTCNAVGIGVQYAYYVYKDKQIVEKIMYKSTPQLDYKVTASGQYMFKVFVRDSYKQIVSKSTNTIKL